MQPQAITKEPEISLDSYEWLALYSCGNKASQLEFERVMTELHGEIPQSQFSAVVERIRKAGGLGFATFELPESGSAQSSFSDRAG